MYRTFVFRKINDFHQWFVLLCREMFDESGSLSKTGTNVARNVISYIERHYTERLTLKQVAGAFYINTSYLGQVFKRETGESFTDYVNNHRIRKAKELLGDRQFQSACLAHNSRDKKE